MCIRDRLLRGRELLFQRRISGKRDRCSSGPPRTVAGADVNGIDAGLGRGRNGHDEREVHRAARQVEVVRSDCRREIARRCNRDRSAPALVCQHLHRYANRLRRAGGKRGLPVWLEDERFGDELRTRKAGRYRKGDFELANALQRRVIVISVESIVDQYAAAIDRVGLHESVDVGRFGDKKMTAPVWVGSRNRRRVNQVVVGALNVCVNVDEMGRIVLVVRAERAVLDLNQAGVRRFGPGADRCERIGKPGKVRPVSAFAAGEQQLVPCGCLLYTSRCV